jgi:serine/threonine protein kinase
MFFIGTLKYHFLVKIKPENLLLDASNNIKLCDFGWCAENINLKRKTFCGTYEYMAPEIVSDIAYDFTIDIWSVGVLLYELLHGYAPFKGILILLRIR